MMLLILVFLVIFYIQSSYFYKLLELLTMFLVLSLMFILSSQPIFMVMVLIMLTLMYSLMVYLNMGSYWYSYVLLLVILSGMLVIFTYMASMIPNSSVEFFFFSFFLLFFIVLSFSMQNLFYMEDKSLLSLKLWDSNMYMFNLFMVSFLLCIMVMVVWLSMLEEGPIRID